MPLFDLLTALLDSWAVWNSVAGSEAAGGAWRGEYLRLTYGCGAYVPYEQLVRAAARTTGLPDTAADALVVLAPGIAAAQVAPIATDAFPARPITLIVPFPAGGPSDALARAVAQGMSIHLSSRS